jgi:transposase
LKDSYSETGRPSIDPELLLRILLIGYLYGVTSERKLVEELRMHLAWRRFTGLGFDQEIQHHSTFSKNRRGRFQESKLFEQLFEQIVRQCVAVGLVQGEQLSVDGSFVEANAAKESRIPREQLVKAAQVNHSAPVSGGTGSAEPGGGIARHKWTRLCSRAVLRFPDQECYDFLTCNGGLCLSRRKPA